MVARLPFAPERLGPVLGPRNGRDRAERSAGKERGADA